MPLPIIAKSSILNVSEFLYPSLKMLSCTKTSPVLCENHSFFLLFRNVTTFIKSHCVYLCYFLQYDELFLISFSDQTVATTILFLWILVATTILFLWILVATTILFLWVLSMVVQSQKTCKRVNFIKKCNRIRLCMSLIIFVIAVFYFDQSSAHLLIFS